MISTGIVIFTGIALLLAKLKREWLLRALHHDMALDLTVTVVMLIIHYGTFSGLMAATVAAITPENVPQWMTSVMAVTATSSAMS